MKLLVFPDHHELDGRHATFAPSVSSWINYDDQKIIDKVINASRKNQGTELHGFAASSIKLTDTLTKSKYDVIRCYKAYLKGKYDRCDDKKLSQEEKDKSYRYLLYLYRTMDYLPDEVWPTITMYVNDAVNLRMTPEAHLFYSWEYFGTADAISYDMEEKMLRIHDLKTGSSPVTFDQLYIYAAFFCLEHDIDPKDISVDLRIYQNGSAIGEVGDILKLEDIINHVVHGKSVLDYSRISGGES